MKRCPACWLVLFIPILLVVRPALADDAPGEITAAQVRAAIEKGVTFLKSAQNQNGSWAEFTGYPGGVTCLCTLALLNAGVPVEDEQMRRALDYIRTLPPEYDLRHLAANHGVVHGGAEERFAPHPPQRRMAGRIAK